MSQSLLIEKLLDGWVFQGQNKQNQFVLLGPYTQANRVTYQVRVGRKCIYDGPATDASSVFLRTCKLPPIPLACVIQKSVVTNNNKFIN